MDSFSFNWIYVVKAFYFASFKILKRLSENKKQMLLGMNSNKKRKFEARSFFGDSNSYPFPFTKKKSARCSSAWWKKCLTTAELTAKKKRWTKSEVKWNIFSNQFFFSRESFKQYLFQEKNKNSINLLPENEFFSTKREVKKFRKNVFFWNKKKKVVRTCGTTNFRSFFKRSIFKDACNDYKNQNSKFH